MVIVAVVGGSGSGKSTVTWQAHVDGVIPTVVSYTTRPMRPGEIDGKEHWFVTPADKPDDLFAYTKFGDYEYWTSVSQLKGMGDIFTYVIDEDGIDFLENNDLVDDVELVLVKIKRDVKTDIDQERQNRDQDRFKYPDEFYDYIIDNSGSLDNLYNEFCKIVADIKGGVIRLDGRYKDREGFHDYQFKFPASTMFAKTKVYDEYGQALENWIGFCNNSPRNKHMLLRQSWAGIDFIEIGDKLILNIKGVVLPDDYSYSLENFNKMLRPWMDLTYIDVYMRRDDEVNPKESKTHISTKRILELTPDGIKYLRMGYRFDAKPDVDDMSITENVCAINHFNSYLGCIEYNVWNKLKFPEKFKKVQERSNYIASSMYNFMKE